MYADLAGTANLTVSQSTAYPGTRVTLTGTGFSSSEAVRFQYNSGNTNVSLGMGAADAGGNFTVAVNFPPAPYGSGYIRAIGQSSGKSGAANLFVNPLLILDPSTGTAGITVVVSGFGFGAGEAVKVFWDTHQFLVGKTNANQPGEFLPEYRL